MRFLFALLLIVVGVAQIVADVTHVINEFHVHSVVGRLADKEPMTKEDMLASEKAVQHVEYFRRFINTGIGYIPPMDPYRRAAMNPIYLDGNNTRLTGTLEVSNVVVSGGSDFSLYSLQVYLKPRRVDFDISMPQLMFKAHYSAVNMEYNGGVMFNTSGVIEVKLEGYRVKGALSVAPNNSTDHFETEGMDVHVGASSGAFTTSTPVGKPTKEDVAEVRNAVYEVVTEAAVEDLSSVLGRYTAQQVMTFMEP